MSDIISSWDQMAINILATKSFELEARMGRLSYLS